MSGSPRCASSAPSRKRTREWTTEVGCTTTSIRSTGTPKSQWASISSRPLFASVAESIVIFGPMRQVGCASASSGVTPSSSARERPRNGPPEAVRTSPRTVSGSRPSRHWCNAECSLSTGTMVPPPRSRAAERQLACGDEALLVRERQGDAVLERPERRADAREADDGVEHHIRGASLQELRRITPDLDVLDAVLGGERLEGRRAGLERTELELGVRCDDLDRLPADRACRTEQGNASHLREGCLSTVFRSCCPFGVTSTPGARRTPPARPREASRAGRGRRRVRPAGCRSPSLPGRA